MGCEIVVGGASARELGAVRELFAARDATFSRFRPDSELSRVNGSRAAVLRVSPAFAAACRMALAASDATLGLVDPTLLDALEAAGYDADFASLHPDPRPPGPAVPGNPRSVRVAGRLLARAPGLRLDLNGVVKAMAVDDALRLLAGPGFDSAGGDLAARGPLEVALPSGGSVRLERGALATSGSRVRRWRRGDSLQHHLIDPRSGRPADSPWAEVTACGATCAAADVAAKAAFLLGHDGPDWLDRHGIPGRFVRRDGSAVGNARWRQTAGAERACT